MFVFPLSRPTTQPFALGRLGVRSPLKNGTVTIPFEPGGAEETCVSKFLISVATKFRMSSVLTVQFIVHRSGIQPPVDEQNAAIFPCGSITGWSEQAKMVPEVPRLTVTTPDDTLPVPMALIILSPPPIETGVPSGRANYFATDGSNLPISSFPVRTSGKQSSKSRLGSIADNIFSDHCRVRIFKKPVPEASPASMQRSPVR